MKFHIYKMESERGVCCYCKGDCNIHSQACGLCVRSLPMCIPQIVPEPEILSREQWLGMTEDEKVEENDLWHLALYTYTEHCKYSDVIPKDFPHDLFVYFK
jgi:hypothetical protein